MAAVDELFSTTESCFGRYQSAQILLHSLAARARNDRDKALLIKCKRLLFLFFFSCFLISFYFLFVDKEAVEKRLYILHHEGKIYATETDTDDLA